MEGGVIGEEWQPDAYGYAGGNPVIDSDPTGLMSEQQQQKIQRLIRIQQAQNEAIQYELDASLWNIEANWWQAVDDSLSSLKGIATGDFGDTALGLGKQLTGVIESYGLGDSALARKGIDQLDTLMTYANPLMAADKAERGFKTLSRSAETLIEKGKTKGLSGALNYLNTSTSQLQKGLSEPVKQGVKKLSELGGNKIGGAINNARQNVSNNKASATSNSKLTASSTNFKNQSTGGNASAKPLSKTSTAAPKSTSVGGASSGPKTGSSSSSSSKGGTSTSSGSKGGKR